MSIVRSGIIVGFFTLLSRILGFVRDIFFTSILGTSIEADCFNIAFRLPNFFRRIFAEGAFSSAFVPIYARKIAANKLQAQDFANKIFSLLSCALLLFIILLEIILPIFMYILAPGFIRTDQIYGLELATELSRITLPYLFFISIVSLLGGMLNSIGRFTSFAASPIFLNLILIVSLFYDFKIDNLYITKVHAMAYAVFIAGVAQLIFMIIMVYRAHIMVKFTTNINLKHDQDIIKLLKNMIPAIIGGGVMQINILIDQAIASFLPVGSISTLIYADRINQLPLALIGTAIGTVLLPSLSKQIRDNTLEKLHYTQNRAIEIGLLFSLPAAFGLISCADIFCELIYEREAFNHMDTINTALILQTLTLGLPAYILVKILVPNFFARYDTKTPLKISIMCLFSNAAISIILIPYIGLAGIAIATSFSAWLNVMLLYYYLKHRDMICLDMRLKINLVKIIISTIIMVSALEVIKHNIQHKMVAIILVTSGVLSFILPLIATKAVSLGEIRAILKK